MDGSLCYTKPPSAYSYRHKLVTEFICRSGCPSQIHTDQGREFESFTSICDKLGIDKTRTCPYRPQSDGMVVRFNRTLQNMLCLFVNEHRNDWDDHLPFITMAYRATQHASSNCTPNILMFGHEIRCPVDEREVAQQIRKEVEEWNNKERGETKERRRRQAETKNTPYVEDKHYNARDEKLTFDFSEKTSKLSRTVIRKKKKY